MHTSGANGNRGRLRINWYRLDDRLIDGIRHDRLFSDSGLRLFCHRNDLAV